LRWYGTYTLLIAPEGIEICNDIKIAYNFIRLLIAPEGIEISVKGGAVACLPPLNRTRRNWNNILWNLGRNKKNLLIAPEGIEICLVCFRVFFSNFLLIAPEGIEIRIKNIFFSKYNTLNRTRRNWNESKLFTRATGWSS